jgi:hypothetical protein
MRTLVYCTTYAEAAGVWQSRIRRWLDAVLGGGLDAQQILIVDDGSPVLPGWADTQLFSGDAVGEAFTVGPRGQVLLFHFRERLGRANAAHDAGWHRSYAFGALYAEANGFERVVHIASDAFLISERARGFVAGVRDGWVAPGNAPGGAPEWAISVAAGDGLRRLAEYARRPYDAAAGRVQESLPFTSVERSLTGGRFGDTAVPVPHNLDYAAQVPAHREQGYYWWLPGAAVRAEPKGSATLRFGEGGDGAGALEGGWAAPDTDFHWMIGSESSLRVPDVAGAGDAVLRLGVAPNVRAGKLESQRLIINVAGRCVRAFDIDRATVLGCDIPSALLRQQGSTLIRLIHPDAVAPASWGPGSKDARRLSFSLEWLTFERW